MSSASRLRFAPSPTGYLHLGSARTALYNWLWARRTGGRFVLRIEDTDEKRNTEEAIATTLSSLRWLGLDWDEGPEVGGPHGPYFQMQRLDVYQQYAERLIAAGAAYRCYCTAEDLKQAREQHKAKTGSEHGFRYPGTCRTRRDEPDLPFTVRLRVPDQGSVGWDDVVKGRVDFELHNLQDSVLIRNNGVPLYNMGAAIDDLTMGITLVARGDDHVINTPQQILIFQALDAPLPQFAHLPVILSPKGGKLSKRDASVAVLDYEREGYLPDAVLNYLARLGWSHGDQEIFTRDELIEKFDWSHVGKTGAQYDQKKFVYVQASHLRAQPLAEAAARVVPFLSRRGLQVDAADPRLAAAVELALPRAATLVELADAVDFYFRQPPTIDPKAQKKFLTDAGVAQLAELATCVEQVEPFQRDALETAVKAWLERAGIALKDVAQPARVALTGRSASPGLFEVMEVLGKQLTLARLRGAANERG